MSRILVAAILLFMATNALAQEKASVYGYITDSSNGETLLFANIILKNTFTGTNSNTSGYYTLTGIQPGSYTVQFTFIGYRTREIEITLTAGENRRIDVALIPEGFTLDDVIVTADELREEARNIGTAQLNTSLIKQLPAVLQADVFRSVQLLPGVKAASDFSSGLYIRGGGPDQTLILLDRTTVYNPSHFFGFFSTFNPDAIKDVRLYKGGYPAEYGGRLGSVLDIYNKDGNRVKQSGVVSLGMLSSRAMIEGPYKKGSYMFAIRRSTIEPLLYVLRQSYDSVPDAFYFYDVNGKVNFDINENNKLNLAVYGGEDNVKIPFGDDLDIKLKYGNRTISSNWTRIHSSSVFSNVTVTGSRYFSLPKFSFGGTEFSRDNTVEEFSVKSDLDWAVSGTNTIKTGIWTGHINLKLRDFFDGANTFSSTLGSAYAIFFAQNTWKPTLTTSFTAGMRGTYFAKGDFFRLEPRTSFEYAPVPEIRLQAAYGRYYQFLSLITNEAFSGFDVWLITGEGVKPSWGDQFVLGAKTYPFAGYNLELEVYYRTMHDLFELDPNLPDAAGLDYKDVFRFGEGYAYGAELFLEKTTGRLNGFIGYAWGTTRRKFPEFNESRFYPPKYDRIHDLNIVINYRLSRRWRSTSVFSYATGQAYTEVLGRTEIQNIFGTSPYRPLTVGRVNASRLPAYHRLDTGFTRDGTFFGLGKAELQFQIINAYSRRNIWFYNFDLEKNPIERTAVPLLPILPTITYTVVF